MRIIGDFIKLPSENIKEYAVRLYRYKDEYGLRNDQIGELLNKETGNSWDESAYRKKYTSYIEGYDDGYKIGYHDGSNGETDTVLQELDKKKDDIYKELCKNRDKLREIRNHLRDESRIENLKDVAIECARIIAKDNPFILEKSIVTTGNDRVAIIQLSDWHFGNVVKNYWNKFDIEEFNKRISQLTYEVIEYCKLMNVSHLKVVNQGDMINGIIHVTSRVSNEEDVISQTQHISEALANVLYEWSNTFDKVDYYSVLDNHSRVTPNKKEHIEKENFARFIDWYLEARLQNVANLTIHKNDIDDNIGVVEIFDEKALFVHGHLDKVGSAVQNLVLMTRIFPIAVFLGHLHHNIEDEVHGIDVIMSPSLSGTDDYSVSVRATGLARQKLTIFQKTDKKIKRLSTFYIEF